MRLAIVGMGSRFYVIPEDATNVSQAIYCAFDAGEAHWAMWVIETNSEYNLIKPCISR